MKTKIWMVALLLMVSGSVFAQGPGPMRGERFPQGRHHPGWHYPGPYGVNPFDVPDLYGLDYRWGRYYDPYHRYSTDDLADMIGYSLYGSRYGRAKSQYRWGMWLTGAGAAMLLVGAFATAGNAAMRNSFDDPFFKEHDSGYALEATCLAFGAAGLGFGIPLWIKGNRGLQAIADDYNQNYGRKALGYGASLSLGTTSNGMGLALNF